MKLSGEEKIPAPREQVWKALNDPEILKKSITGCKELTKTSDTEFSATVQAKVGPVKATFNGDVKLSKLNPPKSYVLSGQGKGGVAGFAKGKATVKLDEDGDHTILTYDVDAQVGGKLAQIGSRLIGSTAKKMANDFFKKFAKLAAADTSDKPTKKTVKKKAVTKKKPVTKKAAAKKPAKKPVKKAAAKKPVKKQAAVASTPSKKSSAVCKPAEPEKQTKIQRPEPNPVMVFVLSAIGAAIILFFFLMFGR